MELYFIFYYFIWPGLTEYEIAEVNFGKCARKMFV